MKANLASSAADGFIGSFKLAAMIIMAVIAVFYGFVNGQAMPSDGHPHNTTDN